jgi:hypothetical protein
MATFRTQLSVGPPRHSVLVLVPPGPCGCLGLGAGGGGPERQLHRGLSPRVLRMYENQLAAANVTGLVNFVQCPFCAYGGKPCAPLCVHVFRPHGYPARAICICVYAHREGGRQW